MSLMEKYFDGNFSFSLIRPNDGERFITKFHQKNQKLTSKYFPELDNEHYIQKSYKAGNIINKLNNTSKNIVDLQH